MVVYSESVQRVLDRICWQDFGKTGELSKLFFECEQALQNIQNSIVTIVADTPLSWKGGTIIKVKYLWFLYKKDNNGNVIVEEVYDAKRNEILTEIKYEPVKRVLEFEKRMNNVEL